MSRQATITVSCVLACLATLSVSTRSAEAFCGFYVAGADAKLFNDATQVVMMRKGTRTVLAMQNSYKGPPSDFAMVVPVPVVLQKENVKTLPGEIFARVDSLGAPRLVEYWEQDPCHVVEYETRTATGRGAGMPSKMRKGKKDGDLGVTVEAQFKVGEYDIVVLSAKDSGGLETWLKRERYKIPAGAEPYLRPYVQSGSKFFVAKVDIKKVKFEGNMAMLSPLRFHYDSEQFSLPIRLGMMNSEGTQDLIVNILAPGQRYELANYPNVTIPTNLDLREEAKGRFGEFYTALFDRTLEKNPRAAVTEYAWDASTCDPCPLPALRPDELHTLGGDVINGDAGVAPPVKRPGKGMPGRVRSRRRMPMQRFVLTRLHLRYKSDAKSEDLVFRQATSIAGGREWRDGDGKLEESSKPHPRNMFQARYAIRHPWTGPIQCKNPMRNRWGGPPAGVAGSQQPTAATRLAFAKRGAKLANLVAQDVPEIGLSAAGGGAAPAPKEPGPETDEKPAGPEKPEPPKKADDSKGCSTGGAGGGVAALGLLALLALRRRRR